MANTKKYLSKDKLDLYDEKLKAKISADDTATLSSAKKYTDDELTNFATEIDEAVDLLTTAIESKADIVHHHNDLYYQKSEIDSLELITVEDIDAICGGSIQYAEDVMF